jgi:hypothetical protein
MVRRVITTIDADGTSVIGHDGEVRQVEYRHTPGFAHGLVWAVGEGTTSTVDDPDAPISKYIPGPGGAVALTVTFPPDSVFGEGFDPSQAVPENIANLPGLAEVFEPDAPGMHTTPTVDYAVVLEGNLVLELDNGATAQLGPGDIVIQNGTRHAWRVPFDKPATIFVVLTGR